jgi:hypothetical protein
MQTQVREVLRRVLVDDAFLDDMLGNPDQALREYDLTDEERSILTSRDRDLLELMRIGGEGTALQFLFLDFDITLVIDLTEFITSLHIDITIDLSDPEVVRRQQQSRDKIASLAESVVAMRAGADRLERIQEMLQVISGATELARRSPGQQPEEKS